jgi:nitroreductase
MPAGTSPLLFERLSEREMSARATAFFERMGTRRSVRDFAPDPVPRTLIELAVAAAHTAPSGANRQPWRFVAVADAGVKREIRVAAEAEEREFYEGEGTPRAWLDSLAPLGTGWRKPFLETAPWLIAVFKEAHGAGPDGGATPNYYAGESVGIACGLFIAALHWRGLATVVYTPQRMRFLNRILDRPASERPFGLFPVGYPAAGCTVPELRKKPLGEVLSWVGAVDAALPPRG